MLNRSVSILTAPLRWHAARHVLLAVGSFVGFGAVKSALDKRYAASGHPVDFVTGQTGFSATAVKGYYAQMDAAGTLPVYVQTQLIDFGFIFFFAATGWLIGLLVARVSGVGTWGRKLGILGGAAIVFGTLMDCAENLVSFAMLADPQGFPAVLALIYSSFAVAKFASIALGMALILASVCCAVVAKLRGLFSR